MQSVGSNGYWAVEEDVLTQLSRAGHPERSENGRLRQSAMQQFRHRPVLWTTYQAGEVLCS